MATLTVHSNVAALSAFCEDNARFALSAVRVAAIENGFYLAEATDGKSLGRVEGKADQFPVERVPGLADAPNGELAALIPGKAFAKALKAAPKLSKVSRKPELANAAVVLGKVQSTIGTTDLTSSNVSPIENVAGIFPQTDEVFPKASDKPIATISIDGQRLAELLKVAVQFAGGGYNSVTLSIYSKNRPVLVEAKNSEQQFKGLVMPLTD